jgi:hypothetical protein
MYGNIAYGDPWEAEPGYSCDSGIIPSKKLWVAAIDTNFTPGTDPSHPAFYLPGQELAAGNSDGYWVSTPCVDVGATCSSNDDCCGGTGSSPTTSCQIMSTATVPPLQQCQELGACANAMQECMTTDDCCTGLACPSGGGVCVVVPNLSYETQTLTREYEADCPHGTQPKWRYFEWQATVPASTSIAFSVQSKLTDTDDYAPATPLALSTATPAKGMGPGTWYSSDDTVEEVFAAASSGVASGRFLRITMTFNPTANAAPTLHEWRQIFDCVPAE